MKKILYQILCSRAGFLVSAAAGLAVGIASRIAAKWFDADLSEDLAAEIAGIAGILAMGWIQALLQRLQGDGIEMGQELAKKLYPNAGIELDRWAGANTRGAWVRAANELEMRREEAPEETEI